MTSSTLNDGYAYRSTVQRGGQSVLDFLCAEFRHSGREVWAARLAAGEVTLDGVAVGGNELLHAGQHLVWNRPPWPEEDVPLQFEVLHQDADLLAVSKPSGLPTMPAGGFLKHTLLHLLRQKWPTAAPLHRLGRGTSGVVLCALTNEAGATLLQDWRTGQVRKTYLALAAGVAPQDFYDIQTSIGPVPHAKLGQIYAANPAGKPSRSLARVLERREASTLFEVEILTGRPHQIRIHLASVGLPLLHDPLYGAGGLPFPDALPSDLGYFLHAHTLQFRHPRTGEEMRVVAGPPEGFTSPFRRCAASSASQLCKSLSPERRG